MVFNREKTLQKLIFNSQINNVDKIVTEIRL